MVYNNAWKPKGSLRKRRALWSFLFPFMLLCKKRILDDKKWVTQIIKDRTCFKESMLNNTFYMRSLMIADILIQYAKCYNHVYNTMFVCEKVIYTLNEMLFFWFRNVFRNVPELTIFWSTFLFLMIFARLAKISLAKIVTT